MVTPLHDFIVIESIEETATETGLIVSDGSKHAVAKATVIAVPENNVYPIKVGDIVIHEKYAPLDIALNVSATEKVTIIDYKDIFAILS